MTKIPDNNNDNYLSVYDTTFIVCDVETTGLSPYLNRITEIALIKIKECQITDTFTTLINPEQHIPAFITYLTGITDADVFDKPTFNEISEKIIKFFEPENGISPVFAGHNVSFDYKFLRESFRRLPEPIDFNYKTICTCKLSRRLFRQLKSKSLSSVSNYLEINQSVKHRAYDDTYATSQILIKLLEILQDKHDFEITNDIIKFQNTKIYSGTTVSPALKRVKINLKDIPVCPGVYYMKSSSGEILYIGKAKNLRDRISTYFRHNSELPEKIRKLLRNIYYLEWEKTASELSALILESHLIKKHKPRFNTASKRYRKHPFIKIDVQNKYPKIQKANEIENDGSYYYGPFSSGMTVNKLLKDIKEKFFVRKCEDKILKPSKKNSNCMYMDINECKAPCNFSITQDDYYNEVKKVHHFLINEGKVSAVKSYKLEMKNHSKKNEFEKAAFLRDRIKDIEKVLRYQKVITSTINNKKIIVKCDNCRSRELFFIHNGKLMKTYTINKEDEFSQRNIVEEITEITDYLFFSLSKYIKHKYTQQELDEIKVISNWLALNMDRNSYLEIDDTHSNKDILNFIFK